jgi:hypothetical protein
MLFRMASPSDGVLFDESVRYERAIDAIDMTEVRRLFATLFDRATVTILRAGYDLDEVIFDRYAIVCGPGPVADSRVPVTAVADVEAFRRAFLRSPAPNPPTGGWGEPAGLAGLGVTVRYDRIGDTFLDHTSP